MASISPTCQSEGFKLFEKFYDLFEKDCKGAELEKKPIDGGLLDITRCNNGWYKFLYQYDNGKSFSTVSKKLRLYDGQQYTLKALNGSLGPVFMLYDNDAKEIVKIEGSDNPCNYYMFTRFDDKENLMLLRGALLALTGYAPAIKFSDGSFLIDELAVLGFFRKDINFGDRTLTLSLENAVKYEQRINEVTDTRPRIRPILLPKSDAAFDR